VVTFRDDLDQCRARLLRYARGLVADRPEARELAEDLVRTTLANRRQIGLLERWFDLEAGLYGLLTRIHRDVVRSGSLGICPAIETGHLRAGGSARPEPTGGHASSADEISHALAELAVEEREALLLVTVERFGYTRSARILKVSRPVLISRLCRARASLAHLSNTCVTMRSGKPRPAHLRLVQ
jgi:RNA polymerase sigma-70 factor (ECF subfamily)